MAFAGLHPAWWLARLADIAALNTAYAGRTPGDFMQRAIERPPATLSTTA